LSGDSPIDKAFGDGNQHHVAGRVEPRVVFANRSGKEPKLIVESIFWDGMIAGNIFRGCYMS
jgi:hypothetical protein